MMISLHFHIAIFKKHTPKKYIFYDLVRNHTFSLQNHNDKRT
jgi:hypothetical protein